MSVAGLPALYHDALLTAGWTIVSEPHRVDANVTTHYGQNDRNIWAFIHMDNNGYSITVADATIMLSKLAADLGSNCHLALTGVLFDFDKSTLKPESDPVLQQVGAMMGKDPALRLEIQGHTDAIGSDAYNQPLSEARALRGSLADDARHRGQPAVRTRLRQDSAYRLQRDRRGPRQEPPRRDRQPGVQGEELTAGGAGRKQMHR
jgi:hypothetical protein